MSLLFPTKYSNDEVVSLAHSFVVPQSVDRLSDKWTIMNIRAYLAKDSGHAGLSGDLTLP
jgi:hypothetical protein